MEDGSKNIKEGSKTVKAVSLVVAEKIFNKLIADKKEKGLPRCR